MSSQFSGGGGVVVSSPDGYPEYPPQNTTLNLQNASGVSVVLCAVVLTAVLLDVEGLAVDMLLVLGVDKFPDG